MGSRRAPLQGNHLPRRAVIPSEVLRSHFVGVFPRQTTILGRRSASWASRKGLHAIISSGAGTLLSGGLHFTTLDMKTCSLRIPTDARSGSAGAPLFRRRDALLILFSSGSFPDKHKGVFRCPARRRVLPGRAQAHLVQPSTFSAVPPSFSLSALLWKKVTATPPPKCLYQRFDIHR